MYTAFLVASSQVKVKILSAVVEGCLYPVFRVVCCILTSKNLDNSWEGQILNLSKGQSHYDASVLQFSIFYLHYISMYKQHLNDQYMVGAIRLVQLLHLRKSR